MELILIKIDAILIVILVHCIYVKDGVRIFISYVSGEMMCGDFVLLSIIGIHTL